MIGGIRVAQVLIVVASLTACAPLPRGSRPAPRGIAAEFRALESRAELAPRDPLVRRSLGLLAWMMGDRARGERELALATRHLPSDPIARLALAMIHEEAGKGKEARRQYMALLSGRGGDEERSVQVMAARTLGRFAESGEADEEREDIVRALIELSGRRPPPDVAVAAARALAAWVFPSGEGSKSVLAGVRARLGCVPSRVAKVASSPPSAPHVALLRQAAPPTELSGRALLGHERCDIVLRSPDSRPALFTLEAFLTASEPTELEIEVSSGNPDVFLRAWLGDELVLTRDSTRRFLPSRVASRARVGKGTSRLAILVATLGDEVPVRVLVRDSRTGQAARGLAMAPAPPATPRPIRSSVKLIGAAPPSRVPSAGDRATSLMVDYFLADHALDRGDVDAASVTLRQLVGAAPRWAAARLLDAMVPLRAPLGPRALARDEARRRLRSAFELDPEMVPIRLALAEILLDQGEYEQVLELVAGQDGAPHLASVRSWLLKSRALHSKGLLHEADAALEKARALSPGACTVLEAQVRRAREKGNLATRRGLAQSLTRCDGDSDAKSWLAREMGDTETHVAEASRLLGRDVGNPRLHLEMASAFLAGGARKEAREHVEMAIDLDPLSEKARIALADILAAEGDAQGARRALEEGLRLAPHLLELRSALSVVGGVDEWAAFRVDGKKVIEEFERDERAGHRPPLGAPAVMVLDRTVVLVGREGSRVTLTHNIVKVLEKDGLEEWGEIHVPEGAELLRARTVKADGSSREPESLAKEGLSAPDLAVGDYVEVEHYVAEPPSAAFPDGLVGDRFFFGTFEAPLDRTELVVVSPHDMPLEWDVRGDAPKPFVTRTEDGRLVTTLADRHRAQLVPEPHGPPIAEHVASVLPMARTSLEAWRDFMAEQVIGARRGDQTVREVAMEIAAGKRGTLEKARALYDFVMTQVEEGGAISEEPALILERRRGKRAILLMALLDAAGIPCELWLARPRTLGDGEPPLSQVTELAVPLVHLRADQSMDAAFPGGAWIDSRARYTPLGYVAPDLRGAAAILVQDPEDRSAKASVVRAQGWSLVPTLGAPDARTMTMEVVISERGSAIVDVVERFSGIAAMAIREHLERTPASELERDLEQRSIGYYFPGSAIQSLAIDGREYKDRPLVLRYRFEAPMFARVRSDGTMEIPTSPMPLEISRRYVAVAERKTPLVLSEVTSSHEARIRIRFPAGHRLKASRPLDTITSIAPSGAARFKRVISTEPFGLLVHETSELSAFARIPPDAYAAFVRFASEVDSAQGQVVLIEKEGPSASESGAPRRR
ncbi:MAG: tetratricopeptide repeat protein [Deltaproteobacteria bacterium]|nr:tetratricopeptide repeat protein [Deltaproteobacteria bacterium]